MGSLLGRRGILRWFSWAVSWVSLRTRAVRGASSGPRGRNNLFSGFTFTVNGVKRTTFCTTLDGCFVVFIADNLFIKLPGGVTGGLVILVAALVIMVEIIRVVVSPILKGVISGAQAG